MILLLFRLFFIVFTSVLGLTSGILRLTVCYVLLHYDVDKSFFELAKHCLLYANPKYV